MERTSVPLHLCRVMKTEMIINRLYMLFNGIALLCLFYYRITTLSQIIKTSEIPILPYLLVFVAEIIFTFQWILDQAYRWRPVTRTVYPERLPEADDKFPPIDVFICTADPSKEPSLGVMNTVISAMALDYPPHKISVYLSDDGGSHVTLHAIREAWKFSKCWLPFCRKFQLKTRCPEAYFSAAEESAHEKFISSNEFIAEKKEIEVINDGDTLDSSQQEMPVLVYVAREKRPSHPHHFKAGAINALIRVSALVSNAPYILVLDCDHYCNDPTSARQAMCFYLDPEISPKLAFVQFPQKFHNISEHDLYDSQLRYYWRKWFGLDGLGGPSIAGCNLYLKRRHSTELRILKMFMHHTSNLSTPRHSSVSQGFRSIFVVFAFIFIASQLKHVQEVVSFGDSIRTALYELRVLMMKSASCYLYATLGAFLDKLGLHEAHFTLTNKVVDDEQARRYQKGIYDFQGSPMLIAPICSLYILNVASFVLGIARIIQSHNANELFVQAFIPLFGIIVNYHVFEGMVLRKDKGRVSPSVSLLSVAIAAFTLFFGSLILIY
ncbi:hypothetical protein DH2020_004752 [Rehmannia glutinosa]|uniref:Cellulose synthase-like protein n=1 Tax=Rehmannia glutinosa TaxID=99300 RepID=A0ABR0XQL7_REHGL